MSADEARFLSEIVPETRLLAELGAERAWAERHQWVFKPCAAYGSKAVYRGDKLTRKKLDEIAREPGYLVQRRVEPGEVHVDTLDGPRAMKFDVRAYAYRGEIVLLGARVYQGQVTNLRSPGGGFSAICVARTAEDRLLALRSCARRRLRPVNLGPLAIALLAAALFGAATPASKWLLGALTPLQLAGLLYLGAALGVAPAVAAGARRWRCHATARDACGSLGAVVLGGGLGPVLLLLGLRPRERGLGRAVAEPRAGGHGAARRVAGSTIGSAPLGWLGAGVAVGAGALLVERRGRGGLRGRRARRGGLRVLGLRQSLDGAHRRRPAAVTTLLEGRRRRAS